MLKREMSPPWQLLQPRPQAGVNVYAASLKTLGSTYVLNQNCMCILFPGSQLLLVKGMTFLCAARLGRKIELTKYIASG